MSKYLISCRNQWYEFFFVSDVRPILIVVWMCDDRSVVVTNSD